MQSIGMKKTPLITKSFKRVLDKLSVKQGLVKTHDAELYERFDKLGGIRMIEYSAEKEKDGVIVVNNKKVEYIYDELKMFGALYNRNYHDLVDGIDDSLSVEDRAKEAIDSVYELYSEWMKSSIPSDNCYLICPKIWNAVDTIKRAYTALFIISLYEYTGSDLLYKAEDVLIRAEMEKDVDEIKIDGENTNTDAMGLRSLKLCFQRLLIFADVWETNKSSKKRKRDH